MRSLKYRAPQFVGGQDSNDIRHRVPCLTQCPCVFLKKFKFFLNYENTGPSCLPL